METFILALLTAASLSGVGYFCGRRVAAAKDTRSPAGPSPEVQRRDVLLHEARNLLNAINLRLFELQQLHQTSESALSDDLMARLIGACVDDAIGLGQVLEEMGEPAPPAMPATHLGDSSQQDRRSRRSRLERASVA